MDRLVELQKENTEIGKDICSRSCSARLFEDSLMARDSVPRNINFAKALKADLVIETPPNTQCKERKVPLTPFKIPIDSATGSGVRNYYEGRTFPLQPVQYSSGYPKDKHWGPAYKEFADTWKTDRGDALAALGIGAGITGVLLTMQYLEQPMGITSMLIGGYELLAQDLPRFLSPGLTGKQRFEHGLSALTDIGLIVAAAGYLNGETRSLTSFAWLAAATAAKAITVVRDPGK